MGYGVVDEREPLSQIVQQSIAKLREHYVMSPSGTYGQMSAQGNALIASVIASHLPPLGRAKLALPMP
jgi:hypothetical protein